MPGGDWNHFISINVRGNPPSLSSGVDTKSTAHVQYPLVKALEREAAAAVIAETKNMISGGSHIRLKINYKRLDFNSESRTHTSLLIGGITNVLTGVLYHSEGDVREIEYSEESIGGSHVDSYEVKVYYR
ncbi:MAG: hypothetical protein IH874_04850 [Candidatus Dadabacteria bacterium]|nr:hypothetical protein [Candidatus Dadabacteria bacterium]